MKTQETNQLLTYLQNDLLSGLREAVQYCKTLKLTPEEEYGLSTRLKAMYYDLEDVIKDNIRQR
jgi:hypothetical protein